MVAISFSVEELKEKLLNGEKDQTIRPCSEERLSQMWEHGLQIYWKQRSPDGYKLFEAEMKNSLVIGFEEDSHNGTDRDHSIYAVEFGRVFPLPNSLQDEIAWRDGFEDVNELVETLKDIYVDDVFSMLFDVIRFEKTDTKSNRNQREEKMIIEDVESEEEAQVVEWIRHSVRVIGEERTKELLDRVIDDEEEVE